MTKPLITYDLNRNLSIDVAHIEGPQLDKSLELLKAAKPTVQGTIVRLSGIEILRLNTDGSHNEQQASRHAHGLSGLMYGVDKNTDRYLVPRLEQNAMHVWIGMSAQEYFNSRWPDEDSAMLSIVLAMAEVHGIHTGIKPTEQALIDGSYSMPSGDDGSLSFKSYGYEASLSPNHGALTGWRTLAFKPPGDAGISTRTLKEEDISLGLTGHLYSARSYNVDYSSQMLALTLGVGRLAYFVAKDRG